MKKRISRLSVILSLMVFTVEVTAQSSEVPSSFFLQSRSSDNSLIVDWFRETEDLNAEITAVTILAGRDDQDFHELLEYLLRNTVNGAGASAETVLYRFLERIRLHTLKDPSRDFASANREILSRMAGSLNSFRTADARAEILYYTDILPPGRAAAVLIETCRDFEMEMTGNRGKLRAERFREMAFFLDKAAETESQALRDSVYRLYRVSAEDWINRRIRENDLLPKPVE